MPAPPFLARPAAGQFSTDARRTKMLRTKILLSNTVFRDLFHRIRAQPRQRLRNVQRFAIILAFVN